jgi:hypothetical protein
VVEILDTNYITKFVSLLQDGRRIHALTRKVDVVEMSEIFGIYPALEPLLLMTEDETSYIVRTTGTKRVG